jgi:fructose-1-phosphate kinase PfkB-like protein
VSAGAAGAAVAERDGAVTLVPAPEVSLRNPIGAGDCLVAGTAARLREGAGLAEAVRWGVALAAASCETFTAGDVDPARAQALLARG